MKSHSIILLSLIVLLPGLAQAQPASPMPLDKIGLEERLGARLPLDKSFATSRGEQVRLGDLLGTGKPALLVLAYNRCSMLCNLVLRGAADLVRASSWTLGQEFSVVTLSIDPDETPHEAARTQQTVIERAGYAGEVSKWPFLVGDKQSIDAVASSVGFRYQWDARTEQFAHPAVLFVIDGQGKVAGYLHGVQHEPERVQALLSGAKGAASLGNASAVLNCFRFDALGRRYGPWIQRLFQVGAAAVFVALGLSIVFLARRERARERENAP